MDKSPRRCYSEYGASSTSKTSSLIPSHVATKIREAQLRQANASRLPLQHEGDTSSASPLNLVRNVSGLNFSLRLPKVLPSWRSTQVAPKQQVDGAENFPSIDTILADRNKDPDTTRTMAETEFYEHVDPDGIVRRRSMMRTVNRDDCLTGRGANPRTGMITPDVHSVVGSLDSVTEPKIEIKLPSAQWKLKDNQWISEIQDEDKNLYPDNTLSRVSEVHTQPLTSPNLRSFSHGFLGDGSKHKLQSPSVEAVLNIGKIRRKPVGSASKVSSNSSEALSRRSVSEDTVIRTPPAAHSNAGNQKVTSFFSPSDVERVRGINRSYKQPRHKYDRLPFLDQLAKPYQMNGIQGFVKGKKNLAQLERCLRTNDGPYPFPPSIPQATINRDELHAKAYLHAAPRPYHPDLTSQLHPEKLQRPSYPERYQTSSVGQESSTITNAECQDDRHQAGPIVNQQKENGRPELGRMNLNTSAPNSTRRCFHQDIGLTREDPSSLRHDTFQEESHRAPNGRTHNYRTMEKSSDGLATNASTARRRPPLGPRENRMISPSTTAWTRMVAKTPSSSIGTLTSVAKEDAAGGIETESFSAELPNRTGTSGLLDSETDTRECSDDLNSSKIELHDHSTCCPRCCVEHDCHEGCLGHSPQGEVDRSETSSLLSMGVFEASFETSVKAINEVLLTPQGKRSSALAKLRQAFVESLWEGNKPLSREPVKQPPLKRTLRQASPIRGRPIISDPIINVKGPRQLDTKQAKTAAQKAMDSNVNSARQRPKSPRSAIVDQAFKRSKKAPISVEDACNKNEANEGRKVSARVVDSQSDEFEGLEEKIEEVQEVFEQITHHIDSKSDVADSVFSKIGALVLHDRMSRPLLTLQPTVMKYGPTVLLKLREMVMVVLDTMTILSCMIRDYKRTGTLVLPDDVSFAEFIGNCLKTLLYLMIAACLYALLVKISRIVLCMLRILLLPVRLCAWVIG